MVSWAVELFSEVFSVCVDWFTDIIDSVEGMPFIISAVLIVFVVSLFLLPMRGRGIDSIANFTVNETHHPNPNKSKNKPHHPNKSKKGD